MTIEEMKEEMTKNGYTVHKKMDEKLLTRRNEVYWKIECYIGTKEYRYRQQFGVYPELYCIEIYAQNKIRAKMKQKYGSIDYSIIPDEQWPNVKEELIKIGKDYIDRRFERMKP